MYLCKTYTSLVIYKRIFREMEHDKIKRGSYLRKPRWLYSKIEGGEKFSFVEKTVEENGPLPPEPEEPEKVAHSIQLMELKHCVITSVDRDDLPDKGAGHWAATIRAIRAANPDVVIEVLIPDYRGEELRTVLEARPDIVGHNLETVRRLTPSIRSKATYENSLGVLQEVAAAGFLAKTGIMLGLGETPEEVEELLRDAHAAGCRMITIGQYLQPGPAQVDVKEYVHPDQFAAYKDYALNLGFDSAESSPLVRSSFMAERSFVEMLVKKKRNEEAEQAAQD